jgi:hypothetical protein
MSSDKLSPFDIAKNLFEKKGRLSDDELKGSYSPFMINRILSNTPDTLFYAQEMNANFQLASRLQYDFYYFGISKRKRYGKWNKKSKDDEEKLAIVKETYGYSDLKAREVIPLLDSIDAWGDMRAALEKGGSKKRGK